MKKKPRPLRDKELTERVFKSVNKQLAFTASQYRPWVAPKEQQGGVFEVDYTPPGLLLVARLEAAREVKPFLGPDVNDSGAQSSGGG